MPSPTGFRDCALRSQNVERQRSRRHFPSGRNERSGTTVFITSVELRRCTPGRAESFVVKLLESGQIAGDHVQQIVRIAEQPLRLHHLWNVHHGVFEGFNGAAIAFAHGDEHRGGKL